MQTTIRFVERKNISLWISVIVTKNLVWVWKSGSVVVNTDKFLANFVELTVHFVDGLWFVEVSNVGNIINWCNRELISSAASSSFAIEHSTLSELLVLTEVEIRGQDSLAHKQRRCCCTVENCFVNIKHLWLTHLTERFAKQRSLAGKKTINLGN